jgi:lipopolysaccharide heptosyltransferase I
MTPLDFSTPPRKVLIIKPSAIGDIVHALPVLSLLRRRWPEAQIHWLVSGPCAGLLEGHPLLSEVIVFNRLRFGHAWRSPTASLALWRFGWGLRTREFDLVIDLQGLLRSGWMSWQSGAPVRIGFALAREGGWAFYTHRVPNTPLSVPAVERYLRLADALGLGREPVEFRFATDDADRQAIAAKLAGLPAPGRYAVLLPGSNWATKRWPTASFAALIEPLRKRFGLECVVAGAAGDLKLAEQIPALNLAGKTNLRELVALLERAALVIANDSGPMHIAAALGRPLVALYGPTSPERTGPHGHMDSVLQLDLPCRSCYSRRCSHQSCLRWLTPQDVLDLADKQLAAGLAPRVQRVDSPATPLDVRGLPRR